MGEFISATQAGKILGLTRQSVTALIRKSELIAIRLPNAGKTTGYKIDVTDVYMLLQERNAPKTEKRCPQCEQTKPFIEFTRCRSRKDGYAAYCRQCRKAQYQENRDHILAQKHEYGQKNKEAIREHRADRYAQHKEEINAKRREYREKNRVHILVRLRERYTTDTEYREKLKEQARQYRMEHPEKVKSTQKAYYDQHKEELNERSRAYQKIHRQRLSKYDRNRYQNDSEYRTRVLAWNSKRKALKRGASTAETVDRQTIIERDEAICYICGAGPLDNSEIHLDHVVPLSKGGPHTPDNLKIACQSCNCKKGDKTLDEVFDLIEQGLFF